MTSLTVVCQHGQAVLVMVTSTRSLMFIVVHHILSLAVEWCDFVRVWVGVGGLLGGCWMHVGMSQAGVYVVHCTFAGMFCCTNMYKPTTHMCMQPPLHNPPHPPTPPQPPHTQDYDAPPPPSPWAIPATYYTSPHNPLQPYTSQPLTHAMSYHIHMTPHHPYPYPPTEDSNNKGGWYPHNQHQRQNHQQQQQEGRPGSKLSSNDQHLVSRMVCVMV